MSVFTSYDAAGTRDALNGFFQSGATRGTTTPTEVDYTNPDGTRVVLTGTGFAFDGSGAATAGTVTGAQWQSADGTVELASFSAAAVALTDLYASWIASYHAPYTVFLSGDDTLTGNDTSDGNLAGGSGDDSIAGGAGSDYIDPGSGSDTIDGGPGDSDQISYSAGYSDPAITHGITVDLGAGSLVDPWGDTDQFTGIEAIRSTRFADTLIGTAADESFIPLAGNDLVEGGDGLDRVRYDVDAKYGGTAGVTVDLGAGTATDGFGDHDTLTGIEEVVGTAQADRLTGGDATLPIGNAWDLYAGAGDDTLIAGAAQAYLQPGAGNDLVEGGASPIDIVSYQEYTGSGTAYINLATGIADDPYGGTDTISGVEEARGTPNADTLIGGTGDNQLFGLGGDDSLVGGGGDDRLRYDRDSQYGGNAGVIVDLGAGTATDGFGDHDSFSGFDEVRGTAYGDSITGGDSDPGTGSAYDAFALAGDDTVIGGSFALYVEPGSGDDSLVGNSGFDQLSYADYTGTVGAAINFATGIANDPYGGTDHFTGFEQGRGGSGNDTIIGSTGYQDFVGLAGDDSFIGGGGDDKVNYSKDYFYGGTLGVTVDLAAGTATDGFGDHDTFSGIDRASGTDQADHLTSGSSDPGTGSADSIYAHGGDDTIISGGYSLYAEPGAGNDSLVGSAARDYISYGDYTGTAGATINFATGIANDPYGGTDQFTGMDWGRGGTGADTMIGDAGDQGFEGLAGNDSFAGGGGDDELSYYRDASYGGMLGVTVDLAAGTATDGFGDHDSFTGIDQVVGTEQADSIIGGDSDPGTGSSYEAYARGGNDTIIAGSHSLYAEPGAGDDSLIGGAGTSDQISYADYRGPTGATINFATGIANDPYGGTDHFTGFEAARGGAGADTLIGSTGVQSFRGLAGDDSMIGSGIDQIRYDSDAFYGGTLGVTVDLAAGTATDGFGDHDSFTGINSVVGTNQADRLTGGDSAPGSGGVYNLFGNGGDDTLIGGGYSLYAVPGSGDDSVIGGTGTVNQLSYATYLGTLGALIDFTTGIANDPYGGTDRFTGLNAARGGSGADTIIGGAGGEVFMGLAGDDSLIGVADDQVRYDADAYGGGTQGVTVNLSAGTATDGFGDHDRLSGFNNVFGSAQADTLIGDARDDTIAGGGGDDSIDGGGGNDTAVFAGALASYMIVVSGGTLHVTGADGSDVLTGIEYLRFDDGTVAAPAEFAIAAADASKAEGNSGATPFTFTVTRTGYLDRVATVNWQVIGGSPNSANPADFAGGVPSGVLTFAAGQSTGTITVGVAGDTAVEPDEHFQVVLGSATGAAVTTGAATGTILNDDAQLAIAATDASKAEGNSGSTPFTFTVTRTGYLDRVATVNWQVIGGSPNSANSADFAGGVPSGVLTFAAGQSTGTITVGVAGDTAVEPDEHFQVVLGTALGATVTTASATGTILNDDSLVPSLAIAASDADKAEGNSGSTPFTFTVTRTGNLAGVSTVNWQVIGGSPNSANPADFAGGVPSGVLTFAAGQSTGTITVGVAGDTAVEPDEHFQVVLGTALGATVTTASATGTILNDDSLVPSLAIAASDADKAEGNSGSTPFTFTVTRTGNLAGVSTVNWQVIGGSPNSANPADFAGGVPSGVLTFAAGQSTGTITVGVAGDTAVEPDEHFQVVLGTALGATVTTASATGTILNDDSLVPSLAIAASDADKAEGNSGSTPFTFTVTRTGNLAGVSTVNWQVIGGSPNSANPADFAGGVPSGVLTFAAGQGTGTITVGVAGDTAVEPDEHFQVVLGTALGATVTTASATGTILNDDSLVPSLAIAASDADKAEGNSGSTPFTFTVTRTGNLAGVSTVNWQVIGGSPNSANPADFAGGVPSGVLTFAAGQSTGTITVGVAGDTAVEPDEHFQVVLGTALGATVTTASATGTILNDDSGAGADIGVALTPLASADFTGDGVADRLSQGSGGALFMLDGASGVMAEVSQSAQGLSFVAAADFDGDGRSDLLLQGAGGQLFDWTMAGATVLHADLVTQLAAGQSVVGTQDHTGDGRADILLHDGAGSGGWTLLAMDGPTITATTHSTTLPDAWQA